MVPPPPRPRQRQPQQAPKQPQQQQQYVVQVSRRDTTVVTRMPAVQPAARPPAGAVGPGAQQAQPPGVLRDRLGVRIPPPAASSAAGASSAAQQGQQGRRKKKAAADWMGFTGGVRPEELTLCPLWEMTGDCGVPSCVRAHSEVGQGQG